MRWLQLCLLLVLLPLAACSLNGKVTTYSLEPHSVYTLGGGDMYALQRVLLGTPRRAFWGGLIFMIITVGVFASFSRAAWGHLAGSALIVYLLCFVFVAHVPMSSLRESPALSPENLASIKSTARTSTCRALRQCSPMSLMLWRNSRCRKR